MNTIKLNGRAVARPEWSRSSVAAAVALVLLGSPAAWAQDGEAEALQGKRVDNARQVTVAMPPPSEQVPQGFGYELPSGVTRADAQAMRAANATLPQTPAQQAVVLAETGTSGALFASGKADLTPASLAALDAVVAQLAGKQGVRIAVVGHTDSQRLAPDTQRRFRDNQGLSESRALAVGSYLRKGLNLPAEAVAMDGKGETQPVASNGNPQGMSQNRRVVITLWWDEVVPAAAAPAPVAALPADACAPAPSTADLPFRVTVDGEDMSGAAVNEADRQRCVDVALERADIQIKYDDLAAKPALNVWSAQDLTLRGEAAQFRGWSNYASWIAKAEVRIFRKGEPTDGKALAVLPLQWEAPTAWTVPVQGQDEYIYVLRVYDHQGRFDETATKSLNIATRARPLNDLDKPGREALVGWGENALQVSNIPVRGGTITVSGTRIKPGERVTVLGQQIPVDDHGRFVARQILATGPHSVDVSVTGSDGRTATFRRNVSIPDNDWFYVAVGDLTVGQNKTTGPAELVTNDLQHYRNDTYVDGRGAFYLKGKIKGEWLLTAAADTREQPLKDLFSNFSEKDPRYLLRRIDPDVYYPVYGDDSTTVDDAPTQGKFFVRLEKGDSQVMWGNFQTSWSGSELIQYSRGLYGARARWRSDEATSFGERRSGLDAFAADPGTMGAREEFRGTGGSLYYMRHQDVTVGSERVWVEVRDRDSGMVIERRQLAAGQDYEVNYLQGRILLSAPLPSTASAGSIVYTSALSGNPLHLVVTYEYVPGVSAVDSMAYGGRVSHWVNDHLRVGMTGYRQGEHEYRQTLQGVDATVRVVAGTQIKAEVARSSGVSDITTTASVDGGYGFNAVNGASPNEAKAYRVEGTLDLAEVTDAYKGTVSAYVQDREKGYSAPGQIAYNGEAIRQVGMKAQLPLTDRTTLQAKADDRAGDYQTSNNVELGLRHQWGEEWSSTVGMRHDKRELKVANASPTLSQNGARTDMQLRADYVPLKDDGKPGEKEDWSLYGFVQGTLDRTEERDANNRAGVGGQLRLNDRWALNAEASGGNLGAGGMLGADYRISDRSNAYLNYRLESENPDTNYRGRYGSWVTGSNYRLNDTTRLFGEVRATDGAGSQSLVQAFGVDLAPNDRWNFGSKVEFGTISDELGGDYDRKAVGFSTSYKFDGIKYAGAVELRRDKNTNGQTRDTWLMRNSYGQQLTPAWRLLGKFNISRSSNSDGAFYDGNFHEAVLGAAYRPVDNDRWNTLVKLTSYNNVPTAGQLDSNGQIADYAQKSQIFSIDTIWDAKPWLSLGFKYGLRVGKLRMNKTEGEWFSSRADLVVLRADWHWVHEWDIVTEVRNLRAKEAQDARAGALVAVYKHVGKHVKAGVGYNFTNYSDDLTDLSYRSRGWFINVLSTF
ncbi:OmpA family protein [Comamonas sp. 17RB]|uniref:OmpA family protein n=1 Tax=Comamonas sp. 17RB TaxID=3047025 RepID=UPI0024B7CEB3|nr:OmpA family protein [Comamonas sp. 17RB]MDI9857409.1 OmpA family protein [Comamonas sp. 17RB]